MGTSLSSPVHLDAIEYNALAFIAIQVFSDPLAFPFEGGLFFESWRAECLAKKPPNTVMARGCVPTAGDCCTMTEFLKDILKDRNDGQPEPVLGHDPAPQQVHEEICRTGADKAE